VAVASAFAKKGFQDLTVLYLPAQTSAMAMGTASTGNAVALQVSTDLTAPFEVV